MKKRFIAFYDAVFFFLIAGVLWTISILMLASGRFEDFDWCVENWWFVLAFASCVAVPITVMLSLQRISIDLSCDKTELFYLVNFKKNERDLNSNWILYPSEIESIEVVRLSNEEKRTYTSARFLFHKYLKVTMKYGHCKFIYVSHYSGRQIQKIIQMLTVTRKHYNQLMQER